MGSTCKSIVGEAASFDEDGLQLWMVKHRSRILETYTERDIFNETGLFFQLVPAKTLAAKTEECVGGEKQQKSHHSVGVREHGRLRQAAAIGPRQAQEIAGLRQGAVNACRVHTQHKGVDDGGDISEVAVRL